MSKYIDHEAAINAALLAKSDADITLVPGPFTNGFIEGAKIKENAILNALADVPAADVVEVRRGQWKLYELFDRSYGRSVYYCTACNHSAVVPTVLDEPIFNFCPNCGANMRPNEEPENLTYISPEERSEVDDD